MRVNTLSIVGMGISAVMAAGIFVGLMLILKLRFKMKLSAFFTGCAAMFLFAFVLESLMHKVILTGPLGETISGNIWIYGLYGAAAAAVFEETGRFIAMKFILKKQHGVASSGIMYGAGHGGFEALYLIGFGMVSNISTAIMINAGMTDLLYTGLDEASAAILTTQLEALCSTSFYMYLVGILERVFAITAQIAMSMIMWKGVTQKKAGYVILPLAMHFILDFVTVLVNNYYGIAATEVAVFAIALAMILAARKIYINDRTADSEN